MDFCSGSATPEAFDACFKACKAAQVCTDKVDGMGNIQDCYNPGVKCIDKTSKIFGVCANNPVQPKCVCIIAP
jgi:hypothetical protein